MHCSIQIYPYRLVFRKPAGTSRGVYLKRDVWYIYLTSNDYPGRVGIGECAPLPNLSCDDFADYETRLRECCDQVEQQGVLDYELLRNFPSALFGLETALAHLRSGHFAFNDTLFAQGEQGIPINGLIWMGSYESMYRQIEQKLASGFHCIKLKIGAIDFEAELELIKAIRKRFSSDVIEIRVDANGAFSKESALEKLKRLAQYDIHSIEQPIAAGSWGDMAQLVQQSPLPIALDEELIGVNDLSIKQQLLDTIRPHYIILKPSLHGGIYGGKEWIDEANRRDIGWWVTSALESNIGLNSIAQWCATLNNPMPQGLGTGGLFINNIEMPLQLRGSELWFTNEE